MAAATEYGIPHVAESLDALVTDPLVDQVLVLTTSQQHEKGILLIMTGLALIAWFFRQEKD